MNQTSFVRLQLQCILAHEECTCTIQLHVPGRKGKVRTISSRTTYVPSCQHHYELCCWIQCRVHRILHEEFLSTQQGIRSKYMDQRGCSISNCGNINPQLAYVSYTGATVVMQFECRLTMLFTSVLLYSLICLPHMHRPQATINLHTSLFHSHMYISHTIEYKWEMTRRIIT